MMRWLLCWCLLVSWAGAEEAMDPLQKFATEFVAITPGQGDFPATMKQGTADLAAAQPVHEVTLKHSFQMAKYEVPQNLYEQVMGINPSLWKGARNSVEMLTPAEAQQFCEKATALLRERKLLSAEEVIRLPTELEWEYCCRAGTTTRYSFGDAAQNAGDAGTKATRLDKYGWHTGNAAGNDPPVGALAPNPWGLYDMHGYLWEICSDPWKPDYAEGTDADAQGAHVMRGGSWKDSYQKLASASRQKFLAAGKDDAVGFRCVKAAVR
ncbi:MAG: formylglycine-generating enzyme family protein [Planctomycetota bacterium]|nr:MAG: formylglycine-generating enzyme family protein [Planctomycetota bacterium]